MSLAEEYARQAARRRWDALFEALPELAGRRVLDLGCGAGHQAELLAARGARIVGLEADEELLLAGRARAPERVEFRSADLRDELPELGAFDGLWSSFVAAYFVDLDAALARWTGPLRSGGWIALVEVDDMFDHGPLGDEVKELLERYVQDSLVKRRYDFRMGRRLAPALAAAGFERIRELDLPDEELAGPGPARAEVLAAWRARFERMRLLQAHCGAEFERVRESFLGCLARPDHRSTARVVACVAFQR